MVGLGFTMLGLGLWYWIAAWKRRRGNREQLSRLLLWGTAIATPFGFIAIEAGWVVTEVGRQPWIIYDIMRTKDAVTEVPGQFAAFGGFTIVYIILAITSVWLLLRLARSPIKIEEAVPKAPTEEEERHAMA
jgi:cytochrome d ubiquinol oxidase subunit I